MEEEEEAEDKKHKTFSWLCQKNGKRILLLIALFVYLVLGALIFLRIENWKDPDYNTVIAKRHRLLCNMWNKSRVMSEGEWKKMADELVSNHENTVKLFYSNKEAHEGTWSYTQSLFFCFTLLTTIGYGSIHPLTPEGRIFTIVYGIIGIPLMVVVLADMGNLFRVLLIALKGCCRRNIWKLIRRIKPSKEDFDQNKFIKTEVLRIWHIIVILVIYVFIGNFLYYELESWNFLDSSYFIFISLTTTGFGDMVPHTSIFLLLTCLYLLFGLVIMAMFINVLTERLSRTAQLAAKANSRMLLKVIEELEHKRDNFHHHGTHGQSTPLQTRSV